MESDNQPIKTRPSDGDTVVPSSDPVTSSDNAEKTEAAKTDPAVNAANTNLSPLDGNIPTSVEFAPIPVSEAEKVPEPTAKITIEDKLEAARAAMEGPERLAERKKRELEEKITSQSAELEAEREKIGLEKEKMELAWIDLDNKRSSLKRELEPIEKEEEQIESEEKTAETEEQAAALPAQKHLAEKKRQEKEAARKAIEEKKWVIEDKIAAIDSQITENTKKYQALLDSEDQVLKKIEELKKELI